MARRASESATKYSSGTAKSRAAGIQEAARAARYRLLGGVVPRPGCLHLLTGHHREDQVETYLLRRDAHSGADGLAGMSAIREIDGFGSCGRCSTYPRLG